MKFKNRKYPKKSKNKQDDILNQPSSHKMRKYPHNQATAFKVQ